MAAGVHHALVARGVGEPRPLGDRQRVDVGAQHHGAAVAGGRRAAPDAGQHPRAGYAAVFDAQCVELRRDEGGGVVLGERAFGVRVQVAAEFDGCHGAFGG